MSMPGLHSGALPLLYIFGRQPTADRSPPAHDAALGARRHGCGRPGIPVAGRSLGEGAVAAFFSWLQQNERSIDADF